ncbi:MAG: hypothetical protein NTY01_21135 [Verrucomicrobia bacterium]|nr:hypothetical protein [Verrucomicrobiota bacterium]
MKFIISALTAIAICCMVATGAEEKKKGDGKRPPMTAEQKEFQKKMVEKYDANKDGKLDKEEKAKMSDEDKAKQKELFPHAAKPAKKKTE